MRAELPQEIALETAAEKAFELLRSSQPRGHVEALPISSDPCQAIRAAKHSLDFR